MHEEMKCFCSESKLQSHDSGSLACKNSSRNALIIFGMKEPNGFLCKNVVKH